jgi:ATP-dependent 26S proteasome regulatory subunit
MEDTQTPPNSKTFSCDLCDYKSARAYNVTRHKLLKHNVSSSKTEDKSTQTDDHISVQSTHDTKNTPETVAIVETVSSCPYIITFKDNECIDILSDHIKLPMARHIFSDPQDQRGVLRKYALALLNRQENQCIKKTSSRYAQSEIHIGNNVWMPRQDTDIYRAFATSIAHNLHNFMETRKEKRSYEAFDGIFNKLDKYVNYMADYGYINTDNKDLKRRMLTDFRLFAKDVCIIVGNLKNK